MRVIPYFAGSPSDVAYQYRSWAGMLNDWNFESFENVGLHQVRGDNPLDGGMEDIMDHWAWVREESLARLGTLGFPVMDFEPWVSEDADHRSSWRWLNQWEHPDDMRTVLWWIEGLRHCLLEREYDGPMYWYNLRERVADVKNITRIHTRGDVEGLVTNKIDRWIYVTDVWCVDPQMSQVDVGALKAQDKPVALWLHGSTKYDVEAAYNALTS